MRVVLSVLGLIGLMGCATEHAPTFVIPGSDSEVGAPLKGAPMQAFEDGLIAFGKTENPGVGPIFNRRTCAECHLNGAIGGAGDPLVTRIGQYVDGGFTPLASVGGTLIQTESLGKFISADGQQCDVPKEQIPDGALTIHRNSTPTFGMGLVDSMPDQWFETLAAGQREAVRGIVNRVKVTLPDPADPSQQVGSLRVGRFGWKSQTSSVVQFSAEAGLNEIGVSSQHCSNGASVDTFATELAPNGMQISLECQDGVPGIDTAAGECLEGESKLAPEIQQIATFMTFLSEPPSVVVVEDPSLVAQLELGQEMFQAAKCNECHIDSAFTTPQHPHTGVPGNHKFYPFSDFLLHDMGSLGDGFGINPGDGVEIGRLMRTAPLWGMRYRHLLLHDGRTADLNVAITAHDGQGRESAEAYMAMDPEERTALRKYCASL